MTNNITTDKSIVVLPFKNLSGDNQNDYLSDGITEEIINALTKIEGLKVTARTSSFAFKNKPTDVRIIGNELGVTNAVEGSIRMAKERIRISAQLTRTDTGFLLWSEKFDRKMDDMFELQDEISLLIADKIRENFGHLNLEDNLVTKRTDSVQAYENYLKGRFYFFKWDLPSMEKAISFFEKSIRLDPDFSEPYFNIGMSHSLLGAWGFFPKHESFKKATEYFALGTELGELSPEAHYVLATFEFWGKWNHVKGYEHLQQAFNDNPKDALILDFIAEIHRSTGNFKEGITLNNQALLLDPLSVNALYTRSTLLYLKGDFTATITYIEKGLGLDANFILLQNLKILTLIQLQRKEELISYLNNEPSQLLKRLGLSLYGLFHQENLEKPQINQLIEELDSLEQPLLFPWDVYLNLYADHQERALTLLKEKVGAQMGQVIIYKNDPFLKLLAHEIANDDVLRSNFLVDDAKSFDNSSKPAANRIVHPPEDEIKAHIAEMIALMESEQLYTNQELTLRTLAGRINMHPNKLSWLLNERVGKNFNDFVNNYRLIAFKEKALNPENTHLTLLGMAYESGFNSKTVFNTYFKKMNGKTPKQWVKEHQ